MRGYRRRALALSMGVMLTMAVLAHSSATVFAAFPGKNGLIAFTNVNGETGQASITTSSLDGSGQLPIVSATVGAESILGAPRWSADGKKLTYTLGDATNGFNIYVANPDGTGIQNVTNFVDASDNSGLYSSFHPNGTTLAYGEAWYEGNDPDQPRSRIVTNNLAGTDVQPLTTASDSTCDAYPLFSPDGARIAFWRSDTTSGTSGIYLMNADGSDLRELVQLAASGVTDTNCLGDLQGTYPNAFSSPSIHAATPFDWSPDGTNIVFSRIQSNGSGGTSEILTVDLNGNTSTVLSATSVGVDPDTDPSESPVTMTAHFYNNPTYTPEGQIVAKYVDVVLTAHWDSDNSNWQTDEVPQSAHLAIEIFNLNGDVVGTIDEYTWQTGDDMSLLGQLQMVAIYGYALPSVQPVLSAATNTGATNPTQSLAESGTSVMPTALAAATLVTAAAGLAAQARRTRPASRAV